MTSSLNRKLGTKKKWLKLTNNLSAFFWNNGRSVTNKDEQYSTTNRMLSGIKYLFLKLRRFLGKLKENLNWTDIKFFANFLSMKILPIRAGNAPNIGCKAYIRIYIRTHTNWYTWKYLEGLCKRICRRVRNLRQRMLL